MTGVIDLGEVRHVPEAAVPRPAPWLSPGLRRGLAALGAAVALLTAGAAAPVRGDLVEVTLPVSANYSFASGDAVYLTDYDTIVRYELPDARERWRAPVPPIGRSQHAFPLGELVLFTGEGPESETVALDGTTAEQRWRQPGAPFHTGDDQVLLWHRRPGEPTVRYTMVDAATGAARWTLTSPDDTPPVIDDDRFVRWSPTGQVEVRDLRSGQVRATGAVPPPDADAVSRDSGPGVQMVGDLILVARWRDRQAMVDAYDLERFARRWTAAVDLTSEFLSECGDVLCVSQALLRGGMRALDVDTGRVRWSNDRMARVHRFGPVLLGYGLSTDVPQIMVVDPADGHLRANLGPWELGWSYRDDGRLLATRPDSHGNTWIAELDPLAGITRMLGLARDAYGCQHRDGMVTCRRSGGTTGIWYPRRRLDG
ncbi:PQQ-binding-like beta-propeller repeat protein [Actinomycetes bacterium KLBMP 9797]